MNLPKDVKYIIETLNLNGYEAFIVGGCVRDYLLGLKPKDWDITTSALPQEVKKLFNHTYDTGIAHGTVTVVLNHKNYEVTTYRIEGDYVDFRHPGEVIFTKHIDDDLSRRDFTMNAIAYHDKIGFADPFRGLEDIENKIIKGVGNPFDRFNEDALRMMRAVRFSAQLNFDIEKNTLDALIKNAHLIKNISIERIRDEFIKLITSNHVNKVMLLKYTSLLSYFLPELDLILESESFKIIHSLSICKKEIPVLFTILFNKLNEENVKSIMKRLKFDTKTINHTFILIKYFNLEIINNPYKIRKLLSLINIETFKDLLCLKKIDAEVNNSNKNLDYFNETERILKNIIKDNNCINLKNLCINGNDILSLGLKDGKIIGNLLNIALDYVLMYPDKNQKEVLMTYIKEKI